MALNNARFNAPSGNAFKLRHNLTIPMSMNNFILSLSLLAPISAFAAPVTYICSYDYFSDEEGRHNVKDEFILRFIVDGDGGKAYIVGNQGSSEVTVVQHELGNIAFIEITNSGNVMTTAIDNKGNTVHSRNTIIAGEIAPSQY